MAEHILPVSALREYFEPKSVVKLMQFDRTISLYSLAAEGKQLVLAYVAGHDGLVISKTNRLPCETERKGPLLKDQN